MADAGRRQLVSGFLGEVGYRRAIALQDNIRRGLLRGEEREHLLLLEHPHVYTLGRSVSAEDMLASQAWLAARRVSVEACDRGGQVTYHGPGQLVGYPVIDLRPDRRDVRRYVRDLQQVLVRTLATFGVTARGGEEPSRVGVWVADRKIASIGVHLSRWITTHGFALNVTTDLSFFSGIVACGLRQVEMTSIEKATGSRPAVAEVAEVCAEEFARVFERELVPLPSSAAG